MARSNHFILIFILLGTGLIAPASAQTDAEYLSAINFRFSNPGARARGMGGVLVPLADDDATAAFVNPAGMAFLEGSQLTVEYISEEDEFPSPRVETGLIDGAPAMEPQRRQVETDSEFASFASYMFDTPSQKWGISAFYANLFDTNTGSVESFTDVAYFPEIDPTVIFRSFLSTVSAKNEIIGLSYGRRLGPKFAIGISVGVSRFDFAGESRRSSANDPNEFANAQSSLVDDETDVFITFGGLWKITDNWSLGGSWQNESSYDMSNRSESLSTNPPTPFRTFSSEFTIPSRGALGLVYRNTDWTVGIEADFVQYSDLLSETQSFFGNNSQDPDYGYEIDDVLELHVGVEYNFGTQASDNTWSLRAGYWRDQNHVPYYTGQAALERAWSPKLEEDIHHWTVGLGFETERFIFGVAADFSSDAGTDVLASVIFRGGSKN